MNVNADALSRFFQEFAEAESKHLQVDDNDTFRTSQEKMITKKNFTRNKQKNSRNELKPLKRRNLNLVIVLDDIDHFSRKCTKPWNWKH